MSGLLDKIQTTDDTNAAILAMLLRLDEKMSRQEKKQDNLNLHGNLSKLDPGIFDKEELENQFSFPENFVVKSHPNYYGSPLGSSRYADARTTSSTSNTSIISVTPSSNSIVLPRKLSCPYAATEFGTLEWTVEVGGKNILGENGIIDNPHWFERIGDLTSAEKIEVFVLETDTAQDFTAILEYLEINSKDYDKFLEVYNQ